nr:MAG TPA: minor structural protein [Caudoviricetes sp.]
MALSRKFLKALGIEDDKIDEIVEAHGETVSALKAEISEAKEKAEGAEAERARADELQKRLDAMGTDGGDEWKTKYEEEHQAFAEYKKAIDAEKVHAAKADAYRKILRDAGVSEKRIDAILKVSDVDGIEFDEAGKVKDADAVAEAVKSEWADFIETRSVGGVVVGKPLPGSGAAKMTRDEIMAVKDTAERQRLIASNPEAFNIRV